MKMVSTLVRIGILVVGILIFTNVTNSSNWGNSSSNSLDNISFATYMLVDWGFVVLLIGVLLSMAMVGAAYLVMDERKENLVWDGGESSD